MEIKFDDIKVLVIVAIAMLAISIIAIVTAINTGNGEHWIQTIVASALTLITAFGVGKKIKDGKK